VRQIGVDIKAGSKVVAAPVTLTPAEIGLFAAVGATTLSVSRRPVVGVLSTGDELLSPDEPLAPGKIRDCNRSTLLSWAASQSAPAEVIDLGVCRDAGESLEQMLASAAARCDVILTSGGVSMGEADLLKEVRSQKKLASTVGPCNVADPPSAGSTFPGRDHPLWPTQHEAGQADYFHRASSAFRCC